ncbi:GAP family protein [Enterococcus sp. HY326]|uniref:GAP family protein n=1 Tax=Enterococcus sp. HY326 TaxID=2971265 RepID=UPI0022403EBE|nr:GAP family protein [Enterococcus sp. HY326]
MFTLLSMTLVTSAADSLNPIAIAQQLVFQSVSRKKNDIIGFILGIGLTNFAAGVLVYYGLAALVQRYLTGILTAYPQIIPIGEIIIGLVLVGYLVHRWVRRKAVVTNEETEIKKPTKTLDFKTLFGLGIISCGLELTSALPYFAFLAILLQYELPFIGVVAILAIYNVIYSMPLIVIFACSLYFSDHLDRFYKKFTVLMGFVISKVIPLLWLACSWYF